MSRVIRSAAGAWVSTRSTTSNGRRLASIYNRPKYSPNTPNISNLAPPKISMRVIRLVQPSTTWPDSQDRIVYTSSSSPTPPIATPVSEASRSGMTENPVMASNASMTMRRSG